MELGFCGLGGMGTGMALRLLEQGHRLTVWNRTAAKAAPLLARGAAWAETPAAVAARNEIVFSSLFDAAAVRAVYDGPDGLLSGEVAGKLFVETSTVSPDFARTQAAAARAKGAGYLDCPMGGSPGPAQAGKLLGLCGGDAADFARAKPILDGMTRRLEHLGPSGSGATLKLAITLPLATYWAVFGEALGMCRDLAVEPALLVELFYSSSGGIRGLDTRGPKIVAALESGTEPEIGFSIDGLRKDLVNMVKLAQLQGFAAPVAEAALGSYEAATHEGWGERDQTQMTIYRVMKARAAKASGQA
jgi:3-hydroxyisobutyrate dehydrogenase